MYEIVTEGLNKIKATDNHKFLTQRGYVQVADLKIGEDYLCLDNISAQKTKYILNDDQLQIMLGSFLGDGNLHQESNFKTYRLKFIQEKEPNILFVIKYAYPPKNKVSIIMGMISLSEK